jgi:hypothetical protein
MASLSAVRPCGACFAAATFPAAGAHASLLILPPAVPDDVT